MGSDNNKKPGGINPVYISRGKKKSPGCYIILSVFLLFIFGLIVGISSSGIDNTEAVTNTTAYTDRELLTMEGHPVIYDTYAEVEEFYGRIADDRIKVTDVAEYTTITRDLAKTTDDKTLMYLIADPDNQNYLGRVHFNLFDPDLCEGTTPESALNILASYLPSNFTELYGKDAAYCHSNDQRTAYVYSCRLNDEGIAYHNEGNYQYSNYYSLYIIHLNEGNQWILKTDYSAYGGQDKGWIEKYTDNWDVNLNDYINSPAPQNN